jgi:hypothetical protein
MTDETTAVDRFDDESPQATPSLEGYEASGDTADLGEPDAPVGSTESDYTAVEDSPTPEWVAEKTEAVEASVESADEAYKAGPDVDARVALAAAPHREITAQEPQDVNELVQVEVGPDNDGDGTSEDLPMERLVKELAESGQLFEKGGPLPNGELSDGADGMFLAERSKQTGEKLF